MVEQKVVANSKRIEWIDIAKGLGIILVVLGHSGIGGGVYRWLFSFHMPFFFLVSGLLFSHSKYPTLLLFIKRRGVNLLLPYFIFTIIVLLWIYLLDTPIFRSDFSVIYNGWDGYPLWFIPVLFGAEICYYLISRCFKSRILIFVSLIASSVLGFICYVNNIHVAYNLEVIFTALFFYGLGNLFKDSVSKIIYKCEEYNIFVVLLFIVGLLCVGFYFELLNSSILDLANNRIGQYFPAYLAALSGTAMMLV